MHNQCDATETDDLHLFSRVNALIVRSRIMNEKFNARTKTTTTTRTTLQYISAIN